MNQFKELGIREDIIKAIGALGFSAPTPVQMQVIPRMLHEGGDLIGLAQTGTGKTAAFGIPLIQLTDAARRVPQALVLCPTRELCVQVSRDLTALAKYASTVSVLAVYGGASMEQQIRALDRGVQIIVATPGRLQDLINRGRVDLSAVRLVVLDEADEMLQMGFQEELDAILATTPDRKNTLLFSATMPRGVAAITGKYMKNPLEITVGRRNAGTENVKHAYCLVRIKERYLALKRLVDYYPELYAIIFCRTRQETKEVADRLLADGYNADALHGDLSQSQRDGVMQKFRRRNLQLLVATDVAARGLDVQDLTHVIHYNLPDDNAVYTHRSGRTGRAGKTGVSLSITLPRETNKIREIENRLQRKFERIAIPDGREICRKRLDALLDTVCQTEPARELEPLLAAMSEKLADLDKEELVKKFIALQFNPTLEYYRSAGNLNVGTAGAGTPARAAKEKKTSQFTLLRINIGKKDGIHASRLIGEINEMSGGVRVRIGRIDISDKYSFFETESRFAPHVIDAFQQRIINGKPVVVKISAEPLAPIRQHRTRHDQNPAAGHRLTAGKIKKKNIWKKTAGGLV